jgi:predicted Zn-dependent peptidase
LLVRRSGAATFTAYLRVRVGGVDEPAGFTGMAHIFEHMAFKGTASRDCQRINLDAESLGAMVNAHTDKDHSAFHMTGLTRDAPALLHMLADIVQHGSFPADELERERQVILHEYTDFDEDPVSMAFRLFDRACYGLHPAGQPVIGSRANLERLTRADLQAHVARLYTGPNVVVAVAGPVEAQAFARQVEAAFGALPGGTPNTVEAPTWHGGVKLRRMAGSAQCQLVLGHGMPPLADAKHTAWVLAAALLGEGMSSPLLDEIRERRGLAYHVGCSADVGALAAQFVIDAATAPGQADELLQAVAVLLQRHAEKTDSVALARARKQLAVRALRTLEQPVRRLEAAVQDVYTFGRVRGTEEQLQALHDVTPAQVRRVFATIATRPAAVGLAGSVTARAREQAEALFVAEGRAATTIGA